VEAMLAKSKTDIWPPKRAKDLSDNEEPIIQQSITLAAEPARVNARIDNDDEMLNMPTVDTLNTDEQRRMPMIDKPEPHRAAVRMEIDDANDAKLSTEMALPRREYERKESDEPNRKLSIIDKPPRTAVVLPLE
jgi:hypothetical protein